MATRDPAATRERLLAAGQQEIYLRGFQGASVGAILARAGVTKGAFFHHFPTKAEFGYSVVEEVLAAMIAAQWADPLSDTADPLETIAAEYERGVELLHQQQPILGCPLNNLAQEMNPLDEGFRTRIQAVFAAWHAAFRQALQQGQQRGIVRADIDASDTAHALVAQIEGTLSLARNSQNAEDLTAGCRSLRRFLESLRAPAAAQPASTSTSRPKHGVWCRG
jgi:AcrR family transcriptional regulator